MFKEISNKINNLIFGKNADLEVFERIFILLSFLTLTILFIGFLSNILVGLNYLANLPLLCAIAIVIYFYVRARNYGKYKQGTTPLFVFSLVLLTFAWFFNAGYDGINTSTFFLFFFAVYLIVRKKQRNIVFISYLVVFVSLIIIQNYFPQLIISYDTPYQRFTDILINGTLYFVFLYFIMNIIINNYEMENKKNKAINEELKFKNKKIEEANKIMAENSMLLSMAYSAAKQGWFDMNIPTGKIDVSPEYPILLGYTSEEFTTSFQIWKDSIHPDDVAQVLNDFQKIILSDQVSTIQFRRKTKSGDWKWIRSVGKVIERSPEGEPIRFIGVKMDIDETVKAEQYLRDSEEKYRALVNNTMEGIIILDIVGTILFANKAAMNMFKLPSIEQTINRKVFDFIAPESVRRVMEDFRNILNGKDAYISEYKCFNALGEELWIESIGKVINYEGKLADLVSLRDITDRKRAEELIRESQEKYKNLFDTMPTGFYRSTHDGYFIEANPAFIKMLGYDSWDDLKTVHIPSTLYVQKSEREENIAFNIDFTDNIEIYRLRRKDRNIVWLEDHARYIKDENGNVLFHEGICKDITERLRIDAELRESEARLRNLNVTKDKFFSIIAHDLRNPLGSFKDITKLLSDEYNSFTENERKEFLELIKNSSTQVYSLLENLLDWSRSQRGLIDFNPVETDLSLIAQNCIDILNIATSKKKITLLNNIPAGTQCVADPNLITTVFRNIISNSIKFTNDNGRIETGILENFSNGGQMTNVYIRDNGIGMSPEHIEKLFRIDQNVSRPGTAQEAGTGLGLILCKEFIEKHQGKIWVESEIDKGSTFYFTLPNE